MRALDQNTMRNLWERVSFYWNEIDIATNDTLMVQKGKDPHAQHSNEAKEDETKSKLPTISITMTIHLSNLRNKYFQTVTLPSCLTSQHNCLSGEE